MTVQTTKVQVPANDVLGTKEKTLHYIIIENNGEKAVINVGEKTVKQVTEVINAKPKK